LASVTLFHQYRHLLFAIAYRMLGSAMDAEDIVQETFLRWQAADEAAVQQPKAYLTAVVTRLSIDTLRSARVQREQYVGPWLPEPLMSEKMPDVAAMAVLADSLSMAFMVLLEKLSPEERAIFLLREIFDYDYGEIAAVVGKSEANCRQLLSRAKRYIKENRPRYQASSEEQQRLLGQFLQVCSAGDMDGLLSLLSDEIVLKSDGGGKVTAARRPIVGATNVARFLFGLIRLAPAGMQLQVTPINGEVGLAFYYGNGRAQSTFSFAVGDGRIQAIYVVVNPDKLQRVARLDGKIV
jgi:RNA polymerase sigma-70 factor, ECF subfamily